MSLTIEDYGKLVTFSVVQPGILPTKYERVKILAILDPDTATIFLEDIAAIHANIFPFLPAGTPNSYRGYNYVKLQLPNGQITCLGEPWINYNTLVTHTNQPINITINNASVSLIQPLREMLQRAGITDFTITPG